MEDARRAGWVKWLDKILLLAFLVALAVGVPLYFVWQVARR
jgi:hypothetical protein